MSVPTDIFGNPTPRVRTIRSFGSEPIAAIVGTGAATLLFVGVDAALIVAESGAATVTPAFAAISIVLVVAANVVGYATLLPWMFAARHRLEVGGYEAPARWKVWAGWLIPIYALFAPYRVMKATRVRVKNSSDTGLKLWWGGWIAFVSFDRVYGSQPVGSPVGVFALLVSIPAVVVSYVFLAKHIREVTASFAPASVTDPVAAAA